MSVDKQIARTLQKSIKEVSETFKVLLLSGPEQVGKDLFLRKVDAVPVCYL